MIYKKIVLGKQQQVFFTADTHFGHKNICRGATEWNLDDHGGEDSVRNFDTLEEMNDALVKGINDRVRKDDWLIHLGDWSFGGKDQIWEFRKRINCKNIVLIVGNHDEHIMKDKVISLPGYDPQDFRNSRFEPHVYIDPNGDESVHKTHAQDLFDSSFVNCELTVLNGYCGTKKRYNLSHFPYVGSDKQHYGRVALHGHTHSSFIHPGRTLDVGMDMAYKMFGEYRVFDEADVENYMIEGDRQYHQYSHHNKDS